MADMRTIFAPLSERKAVLRLWTYSKIYLNCYDNENVDFEGECIYDLLNIKDKKNCPLNNSEFFSNCPCKILKEPDT